MFSIEGEEIENPNAIVTGTILVNNYAHILFNSATTHSFINLKFANKRANEPNEMDILLCITYS